ncbi:hypothetical protein MMC06_002732 [Schaereria dolodes]|nr:hypothetical protein [Schaereria dolodes]
MSSKDPVEHGSPGPLQEKDTNAHPKVLKDGTSINHCTGSTTNRSIDRCSSKKRQKTKPAFEQGYGKRSAPKKQKPVASEKTKDQKQWPDLSDIELDHEDEGKIPIFDTCDDIRKKINDLIINTPKANQTSFARKLNKLVVNHEDAKVDGRQLGAFLKEERSARWSTYNGFLHWKRVL